MFHLIEKVNSFESNVLFFIDDQYIQMTAMREEVIYLVLQGKENDAIEIIYQECGDHILEDLKRKYGKSIDAVSILHDAIYKLLALIKTKKATYFSCAYLRQVAKYVALAYIKKETKAKRIYSNEFQSVLMEYGSYLGKFEMDLSSIFGEDNYSKEEKIGLQAFALLKSNCQKLLQLFFVDGKSHAQIPDLMDNISTAASSKEILKRCKQKWRSKIEELKTQNSSVQK
ncbi:MAG: hypothetical protein AAF985_23150 [Bacteroidota bacterium]